MANKFLETHNARVSKCCEPRSNCSIIIPDAPGTYILKGEKLSDGKSSICDCVVLRIQETVEIFLIELKGKKLDITKIKSQLKCGAERALDILDKHEIDKPYLCFVLAAKAFRSTTFKILKDQEGRIKIGATTYRIQYAKCGDKLDSRFYSKRLSH